MNMHARARLLRLRSSLLALAFVGTWGFEARAQPQPQEKPAKPEEPATAKKVSQPTAATPTETKSTEKKDEAPGHATSSERQEKDSSLKELAEEEGQAEGKPKAEDETPSTQEKESADASAEGEDSDARAKKPPPTKDQQAASKEKKEEEDQKPAPPPPPKVDYTKVPWTFHQKRIDLGAGIAVGWVTDPAFDLFQTDNAHPAFDARAAFAFWANGPMSLAATANYNTASVEGEVRTLPSFLGFHRLHLGGEARYHLHPQFYGYGRLNLGAWIANSRLGEVDSPTRMELDGAGFSGALSVGGAARVFGDPDGRKRAPRFHLFAEAGLGYDSPLILEYKMVSEGALRPDPVHLGKLSLGGPRIALGATVSY